MSVKPLRGGRESSRPAALPSAASGLNNEGRRWSVAARSDEVRAIQVALRGSESVGVALTGGQGVGKSSLARAAVAALDADVHVIQLRSSLAGSPTPYGCLSFLLARLSASAMASPIAILQGLTSLIKQDAAGKDCIITLDSANDIDAMSAGVLVSLLLTGTARIVAIAPDSGGLPPDFHWLLSENKLTEVRLANLNEPQTRQVLVALLGHQVASSVVAQYYSITKGNALLLRALVSDQLQCGNLMISDGIWTLQEKVDLAGATSLEDIVRSRWARQRPECREVIEMLACARRVPLVKLTALFGASIVADMEDAGEIAVDTTNFRWVTLQGHYLAEVVRPWISVAKQRELRSRLLDGQEPDLSSMSPRDLIQFASWTLDCEVDLEPGLAIAAAEAAVALYDPDFAFSCLENLKEVDPGWITGQGHKASAYLLLDLPERAWEALAAIPNARSDSLPALELAYLVEVRCRVMAWLPGQREQVPAFLQQMRQQLALDEDAAAWPSPLAQAANRLKLAEFEDKAFRGDYASMLPELERAADARHTADPWFRMQSSLILMSALSMTGRETDALSLMDTIGGQLTDFGHVAGLRERYAIHRFYVLLLAGHWRRCLDVASPSAHPAVFVLPPRAALPELLTGISYVYAEHGAAATEPLLSAIAQLEQRPDAHLLRAAYAAIALAYAQQGKFVLARSYLDRLNERSGPLPFSLLSVTEFCSLTALCRLGDPSAAALLEASACEDILKGRFTRAGNSLLAATVSGGGQQFALMEEAASHRQGIFAEVSRLIAVGCRSHDAKVYLQAADLAGGLELDAVRMRCAVMALECARRKGDSMSARMARTRLDQVSENLSVLPVAPGNGYPLLTSRERQVASLALDGASNRAIAEKIGVSVRTVEGHLYQVFTKLGVSSRGDLPGLV